MNTIYKILSINTKFAYEIEYDSQLKKQFSAPKIYTAKGDLSKRWYVYFSYRDPITEKLKRLTPFYGIANKFKAKEERLEVLTVYRKTILKLLNQGYNPFTDNKELYSRLNSDNTTSESSDEEPVISYKEAFKSRSNFS